MREGICRAASFKIRELICQYIAVAADLDGTFAIVRMQPCFQVAVKIATVAAACRGAALVSAAVASTAAWASLV